MTRLERYTDKIHELLAEGKVRNCSIEYYYNIGVAITKTYSLYGKVYVHAFNLDGTLISDPRG